MRQSGHAYRSNVAFLRSMVTACYFFAALSGAAWSLMRLGSSDSLTILLVIFAGLLLAIHTQRAADRRHLHDEDILLHRDDLTGLPNRRLFLRELNACLERPLAAGQYTAL